jgi:hydroxypyruvate reductase
MTVPPPDIDQMRKDAAAIFHAGLAAVEPAAAVKRYCRREGDRLFVGQASYDLSRVGRIFVIGAGKASAPMATALEGILGSKISGGLVNVKYGHVSPVDRIVLVEAGHPVPDPPGQQGARQILDIARQAGEDDLVFCLFSGGGSALLPLPAAGLTLEDKQQTTQVLLACGATIHEINTLRKHSSQIKGGRLAAMTYPARLVSLILSDVVGDDLDVIASGPTVPDTSTYQDCLRIIEKFDIAAKLPASVLKQFNAGVNGDVPETPKAGDPAFTRTQNQIIGSNIESILAAEKKAQAFGYHTVVLSSMIEGDTTQVARVHAAIAREVLKSARPTETPACILSGGETTVKLTGKGLGGRNQEFALVMAGEIAGLNKIVVLSGGTDGNDGPTDAAGALADSGTLDRARGMRLDPRAFLADNDSYHFFKPLGDLLLTGPTNTNVMDLRIMLVVRPPSAG